MGHAPSNGSIAPSGVESKHARPYNPQTCGKVERFHQTMQKYRAKRPATHSIPELQRQIDAFVRHYDECRATPRH
jgi:transposase InsO family protein